MKAKNIVRRIALIACVLTSLLTPRLKAQIFHITNIHCSFGQDDMALLNRMGKFEVKFYNTVFNTSKNDTLPVYINLYGRTSEYNILNKMPHTTFFNGFYSPTENNICAMKTDQYMQTLFHETSHDILSNNFRNPPRWLNEGIAMIFENLVDQGGEIYFSPQKGRIKLVKDLMFAGKFKLNGFFSLPDSFWFENKIQLDYMYAVSYCVIYYFVKYDLESLSNILTLMKQGYTSANAISKVFGSFDNFQRRFMDFYKPEVDYRP